MKRALTTLAALLMLSGCGSIGNDRVVVWVQGDVHATMQLECSPGERP